MKKLQSQNSKHSFGGGSFYNLLNKDIKELNTVILSLFIIIFLFSMGFISYKITNSYALFSDEVTGVKTIELAVSNDKVFNYTGDVQEYTIPFDGYYYIELAGASGGNAYDTKYLGGLGSKVSGYIYLSSNEKLYIYVGGKGKDGTLLDVVTSSGGYNGGGSSTSNTDKYTGSGGGATDIRLVGGSWDDTSSLISRIMVAGGGGGSSYQPHNSKFGYGGNGGTLYGENGTISSGQDYTVGNGGTQTLGGSGVIAGKFGIGASADNEGAGGGGGYYGGGSAQYFCGAGGGSSYISGYAGVNSVKEMTTITHTNQTLHYSGEYFIDGDMLEGQNLGDGYAKISYIGSKPRKNNSKLSSVRYIKNCTNGNSHDSVKDSWQEVQTMKDGVNIAKGKTVTSTGTIYTGSGGTWSLSNATDGLISNFNNDDAFLKDTGFQCITVDLEKNYDLDEVVIWNDFRNERSQYQNTTYISNDNSSFTKIIDDAMLETSKGHRFNSYSNLINGYVSNGLVLWYDGKANTGTNKNYTTTTWKNLVSSSYTGTLTGGVWYQNYLYLDGIDDFVNTTYKPTYKEYTLEAVVMPKKTSSADQEIFNSHNGGGVGLIYKNNKFYTNGYFSGKYVNVNPDIESELDKKYYVAVTFSSGTMKLYINGKLIKEENNMGTITSGNVPIFIGANPNKDGITADAGYFLNGNIYSARIYEKSLGESQITHNYNYDKFKFNLD